MTWKISFTQNAQKSLNRKKFPEEEIFELIKKTIRKFQGENVNIDVKKLKGGWLGFYRIRKGRIRIIAEFNFENSAVLVEEIDWRGNIYKE